MYLKASLSLMAGPVFVLTPSETWKTQTISEKMRKGQDRRGNRGGSDMPITLQVGHNKIHGCCL